MIKQNKMTNNFKSKGNKQISLRVEPELEKAIHKAVAMDGDASVSAWFKRLARKDIQAKNIKI